MDFSILIYCLTLTCEIDGQGVEDKHYFLTKRSLKRFLKNNDKLIKEYNMKVSCGGERLWIN